MTATDALTPAAITRADLDFDAVLRTYEAISRVLPETPSWSYPLLNAEAGVDVVVKHENIQPTGAFKVRRRGWRSWRRSAPRNGAAAS